MQNETSAADASESTTRTGEVLKHAPKQVCPCVHVVPLVFRAEPRQSEWADKNPLQTAHHRASANPQGDAPSHRGQEEDAVGVVSAVVLAGTLEDANTPACYCD